MPEIIRLQTFAARKLRHSQKTVLVTIKSLRVERSRMFRLETRAREFIFVASLRSSTSKAKRNQKFATRKGEERGVKVPESRG